MGLLAGFRVLGGGLAAGWALARYAFEFAWNPSPGCPCWARWLGALLALAAGWWGCSVLQPGGITLRRAAS